MNININPLILAHAFDEANKEAEMQGSDLWTLQEWAEKVELREQCEHINDEEYKDLLFAISNQ